MSMPMVERAIFSVPLLVLRAKVLGYPFRPKEKTGAIPLWLGPSHGQHDIDPSPAADERAVTPLPAVPFGSNGGKGHKTSRIASARVSRGSSLPACCQGNSGSTLSRHFD